VGQLSNCEGADVFKRRFNVPKLTLSIASTSPCCENGHMETFNYQVGPLKRLAKRLAKRGVIQASNDH
jgi:hypothetical protein